MYILKMAVCQLRFFRRFRNHLPVHSTQTLTTYSEHLTRSGCTLPLQIPINANNHHQLSQCCRPLVCRPEPLLTNKNIAFVSFLQEQCATDSWLTELSEDCQMPPIANFRMFMFVEAEWKQLLTFALMDAISLRTGYGSHLNTLASCLACKSYTLLLSSGH